MPEPLDEFLDAVHRHDVDDILLSAPIVDTTQSKLEDLGESLLNSVAGKKKETPAGPPPIPSGPTPTYQESVLEPRNAGTLYNTTNTHESLPIVTKASQVFKNIKYRVHGFTVSAVYKNKGNNNSYSLITGEKFGVFWQNNEGKVKKGIRATYNIRNGKTNIGYTESSPHSSYNVSIYNDEGNNGICASYTRIDGFNTAFSCDEHSVSAKAGLKKEYSNCNVDLSAYATMGDNYKYPFVGVMGRVTF